jgi:acetolactate decarboxylase
MEKSTQFLVGIVGFGLVLCIVSISSGILFTQDRDVAYQVSTIDALLQGALNGVQTVGELRQHGDFGIGTFDALDGEMILLDGVVYRATADGYVFRAPDTLTVPLATITYFDSDLVLTPGASMNYTTFISTQPERLPLQNMVYAVRIHSSFTSMTVRVIPAQANPSNLTRAVQEQSVYHLTDVTGTVVGLYVPDFLSGLNVPGFHLHFLSDDLSKGGHVLDFTRPAEASVEYDITPEVDMVLPTSGPFTSIDLTQDLSRELAEAEQ